MQEITLMDVLTGGLELQYPNAPVDIAAGKIKFTLSAEEIQMIEKIENYIHALSLSGALDTNRQSLNESALAEAGGLLSWYKRQYQGHDMSLLQQIEEEIKDYDDVASLYKIRDELDHFIHQAETDKAFNFDSGSSKAGTGAIMWRAFTKIFAPFTGIFNIPVAVITTALADGKKIQRFIEELKVLRNRVDGRINKLSKRK